MVTDVCGTCSECFGPFVTHLFPFFFLAELDRPLSVSRFSSSKIREFPVPIYRLCALTGISSSGNVLRKEWTCF